MIREELEELERLHLDAIDSSFSNHATPGWQIYDQAKEKLIQKYEGLEDEVLESYRDVVSQYCYHKDGQVDSQALSTNAFAMRKLAEHGELEIIKEYGRRVIGKWIEPTPPSKGE